MSSIGDTIEDVARNIYILVILLYILGLVSSSFVYAYNKGVLFTWVTPGMLLLCLIWMIFIGYRNKKYKKEISEVKRTYEIKHKSLETEYEEKHKKLEHNYTALNNAVESRENTIKKILTSNTPFKECAQLYADMHIVLYEKSEYYLRHKSHPAKSAADEVNRMKKIQNEEITICREMLYKFEYILDTFPELKNYVDDETALISLGKNISYDDFTENRDRVRDYLSDDEWKKLSVDDKNQLALDRYKKKPKDNWELGIEYEHYIGYLLREGKKPFNGKWHVVQFGELHGLSDLGRDIIAETVSLNEGRIIYIIQCKRWSERKFIHENTICQLYGTTMEYKIKHRHYINCKFVPVFVSTTQLSDMAKQFAVCLGVKVLIVPMGEYPMIKCNINNGEKIYHLPFDQQYHRTEIKREGEFYAMTVKEATSKGFRRAMKHFVNN